ncbi:MAG: peptidylprolyl isomerase [Planctomycetota bacterium]
MTSSWWSQTNLVAPLLLLGLLAGCRSPGPSEIVIARFNDQPLTLQTALETFLDSHVGHGVLVQGESAVRELAGRIIERQVFLSEARALELDQDESVIAATEEYAMRTAELLYWEREVDEQVSIDDEEVEQFYEKTDQALSISLIETRDREQAEELRAQVRDGAEFAALAREHSIHTSSELGGMLSFVKRGEIDPAMEAPVFALGETGDLTPVTQTAEGWAFARLDERTINEMRPDRAVAIPQIRSILEERAAKARREELTAAALEAADVFLDDELLDPETLHGDDRGDATLARSAGDTLTLKEFREYLDLEALASADAETAAEATHGLVNEWIQERAVRAAVRRSGLLDDPEVVAKARVLREDATLQSLYQRYVYADIEITDDDIRAYYEEHRHDEFTRPPEVRLAFVAVPTEEEIQAVAARIQAGEDFGAIAREVSTDAASAAHNGRIGWVRPGTILPELEEAVFALEPGAIDGPIETSAGWFMVHAIERKEAQPLPFEVCRSAAAKRLATERQKAAYRDWSVRLKDRSVATIEEQGVRLAVAWLDREVERRAAQKPEAAGQTPPIPPAGAGGAHGQQAAHGSR